MKVLVVTNMAPFVRGGAEELAAHLLGRLNATAGVQAELLRIPFKWDPAERLIEEMLIARSLRLTNVDRVIGLKFPAYLIPHERKTIWLVHQFRQAYDLFGTAYSNLPATARAGEIRAAIRRADDFCFRQAQEIFTIARVPRERLLKYNGFESEVLPLPLNNPEPFRDAGHGDYIFAGGRIDASKRQHLLVEAMRHVRSAVKLVVGGPPQSDADAERLRQVARAHGLEDRVTFEFGFLPRESIASRVNEALACAYVPLDEDAPGYVTMEAFHASKAVVTATDSGGVLDLVRDEATGYVVPPEPEALAGAFDRLFHDRARTIELGAAARALLLSLEANWPRTIERLIS